jgi:large subunit ribosomal protein L1
MAAATKRRKAAKEKVDSTKVYVIDEALSLVKELATAKFPESIDVSVNLGVDPRKSDQVVRGSTVLPNGTAQGENADKAKAAGADVVGFEDLAETVKGGELNFDVVIATPDAMRVVGQLGQILGPRGLMPNPKVGTVTADVETAVKNAKAGQVRYRTDKAGIIHCPIGRADFEVPALKENLQALLGDLKKAKPAASKGQYVKKLTVSSTMGPGVSVDRGSVDADSRRDAAIVEDRR